MSTVNLFTVTRDTQSQWSRSGERETQFTHENQLICKHQNVKLIIVNTMVEYKNHKISTLPDYMVAVYQPL